MQQKLYAVIISYIASYCLENMENTKNSRFQISEP